MKLPVILTALAVLSALFFTSSVLAHSDRYSHGTSHQERYHQQHSHQHSDYQVNTYVIATRSGPARNYFSYEYDQRRARNLAKHYSEHYRNKERRNSRRHQNYHDHHNADHSTYIILGHRY